MNVYTYSERHVQFDMVHISIIVFLSVSLFNLENLTVKYLQEINKLWRQLVSIYPYKQIHFETLEETYRINNLFEIIPISFLCFWLSNKFCIYVAEIECALYAVYIQIVSLIPQIANLEPLCSNIMQIQDIKRYINVCDHKEPNVI